MVKYRESIIFVDVFCLEHDLDACEVYWDLDFEPFENEWRAASGIGGLRCLAWRLFFGLGFD